MTVQRIYLVANRRAEEECANLLHSIRRSGCGLPICLIPFDGERVRDPYVLRETNLAEVESFPAEAREFVDRLARVLNGCPRSFLYRFLPCFLDEPFIYSDNDIIALMNWERLFPLCEGHDLLHADEEFRTGGRFNFTEPQAGRDLLGDDSMEQAMTAGHFLCRPSPALRAGLEAAVEWFEQHGDITKRHDQVFLQVAAILGVWSVRNLCREPVPWLSSWVGDYSDPLDLVLAIQDGAKGPISHVHFSGGRPSGANPMDAFLYSNDEDRLQKRKLLAALVRDLSGWNWLRRKTRRAKQKLTRGG